MLFALFSPSFRNNQQGNCLKLLVYCPVRFVHHMHPATGEGPRFKVVMNALVALGSDTAPLALLQLRSDREQQRT